uniref:Squalene cyclase C-terminal domain-containing protein n=1 Tax=Candidatus Methanogaster sp. ANME-2c ERB4 TaxID=2759911 RepID=A0A7G9Y443_9EURY|nr:hypothetical protein MENKDEFM_00003 [Methanosarcinales archaeon ANME-2c ERB4]QNO42777.1 hypothetical protein MMHKAGOI_00003 [Methanosarcinales archaeon ANME-2c ERB4]
MIETLFDLSRALVKRQILDKNDSNYGAIQCDSCNCLHTRAGEAVFPLALCYRYSGGNNFLGSAINLGNWLISKQQEEGFWFETPDTWNGTTVFQLMALAAAYPILESNLSSSEKINWIDSIKSATLWICTTISEKYTPINYCASSSAALMLVYQIIKQKKIKEKAKEFAKLTLKRINKDGFICGEGRYIPLLMRGGVDVGYNLDMSIGALAIYSVLSNDADVRSAVVKSLKAHLNFMYPDGSIDNSWGSRSYKWTLYGSKTAHGSQMALGILSDENHIFKKASQLSLNYLKSMINNGLVGYGPHSWWNERSFVPCIYPTFNRANAIAFALCYSYTPKEKYSPPTNSEEDNKIKFFRSINVCLVETENLKATITGYRPTYIRGNFLINVINNLPPYLTPRNPFRGGIQPPTGGSLSYLWAKNFGVVQASSQTKYLSVEPMHMPDIGEIETLTPHIRVLKGSAIFTNLYDLNVHIKTKESKETPIVFCEGKLKDEKGNNSGIKFQYKYEFGAKSVTKMVTLWAKGKNTKIEIIEPIIQAKNMRLLPLNNGIILRTGQNECKITPLTTNVELIHGQDKEKYWSPFPYLYAYPIKLLVNEIKNYPIVVKYNIELKLGSCKGF